MCLFFINFSFFLIRISIIECLLYTQIAILANNNGALPQTPRFSAIGNTKKRSKKREAKYKNTFASFFRIFHCLLLSVNDKIKCRKSVKINVGFPTFLISVTITIEVIVNMNMENENKLRNMLKEMIRLNIKPNFAALGREYGCDYRTAKIKYYEE